MQIEHYGVPFDLEGPRMVKPRACYLMYVSDYVQCGKGSWNFPGPWASVSVKVRVNYIPGGVAKILF